MSILISIFPHCPFCSLPPENSPVELEGGILARYALLEESVPVNGMSVPLNLE